MVLDLILEVSLREDRDPEFLAIRVLDAPVLVALNSRAGVPAKLRLGDDAELESQVKQTRPLRDTAIERHADRNLGLFLDVTALLHVDDEVVAEQFRAILVLLTTDDVDVVSGVVDAGVVGNNAILHDVVMGIGNSDVIDLLFADLLYPDDTLPNGAWLLLIALFCVHVFYSFL